MLIHAYLCCIRVSKPEALEHFIVERLGLRLTAECGRQSYKVRVGLAESVEVAVIAALISSPGKVRRVDAERQERLIDALPLYILKGLGLGAGVLKRLGWLGVERVGQLREWKKAQVMAYLGVEGKALLPYLFGLHRASARALSSTNPRPSPTCCTRHWRSWVHRLL